MSTILEQKSQKLNKLAELEARVRSVQLSEGFRLYDFGGQAVWADGYMTRAYLIKGEKSCAFDPTVDDIESAVRAAEAGCA